MFVLYISTKFQYDAKVEPSKEPSADFAQIKVDFMNFCFICIYFYTKLFKLSWIGGGGWGSQLHPGLSYTMEKNYSADSSGCNSSKNESNDPILKNSSQY
jgi:hypothetical protein